ncbi:MAG: hypothetical protein WC641_06580 [Patescibacteria group bacterium]
MELRFQYDLNKDIENYKIASQSVNNKTPTKMQSRYTAEYGEVFEDRNLESFITEYIAEQKLDMSQEAERIKAAWEPIKPEFLKRVEAMFALESPFEVIHVFLTTDGRCSYDIEHGYFFVSVSRPFQNKTIMHELLHFWTWLVFHEEVESRRMTKECYNDVKESLTELLNIEFQDLLGDAHDDGYPQHQELRAAVGKTWTETKDIKKTFEVTSRLCPIGNQR